MHIIIVASVDGIMEDSTTHETTLICIQRLRRGSSDKIMHVNNGRLVAILRVMLYPANHIHTNGWQHGWACGAHDVAPDNTASCHAHQLIIQGQSADPLRVQAFRVKYN